MKIRKMSGSLTRNRQNHTALYWEPFATSTPLKAIPNNLEIGQIFKKKLIQHEAPVNVVEKLQNGFTNPIVRQNNCTGSNFSNRIRKNSIAYLDVLSTSSSDEDDSGENKKRPIIKLSSRKTTRTLVSFKKSGSEESDIQNKGNPENKLCNYKKLKTTGDSHVISAVKDFKHKSQSPKDGIQHPTPRSGFKIKSFSSDEENKIFDKTKPCEKTKSTIESCLKRKENVNLDKYEKQELKGLLEISNTAERSIKGDILEEGKGHCKTVIKVSKVIKAPKNKAKKVTNTIDPVRRTRSRKIPNKLPAELLQVVENKEPLLPSWKRNHNLSHQLFSDSREQEFINMLDLTREENNEAAEAMKCSVKETEKDLPLKSYMSPHPSIQNICSSKNEPERPERPERPKRTKQPPKEFWLLENAAGKPLHTVATNKQKKMRTKSNDPINEAKVIKKLKEASTSENNLKNNTQKEHPPAKRQKKKCEEKGKNQNTQKDIVEPCSVNNNDIKLDDPEDDQIAPKAHKSTDVESNKNFCAIMTDGNRINFERPVFQKLNELSYTTNGSGCSVNQCWNLNKFKCGIFRLNVKSQFASQTLYKNSCLGGVLIKGDLRMKIGDKDMQLKEGDMAFVPPLTKWQATNIGDCESIFYYWCGRFTG